VRIGVCGFVRAPRDGARSLIYNVFLSKPSSAVVSGRARGSVRPRLARALLNASIRFPDSKSN
jgi:hypothetical protein